MTWNEVEAKYEESMTDWVPATYKSGKKAFINLEKVLREFYPAAIAHPEILADMDENIFRHKFITDMGPHLTVKGEQALRRVRKIIKLAMCIGNPDKNADYEVFRKKDVTACFVKWIASKGWNKIKADYNEASQIDVTAEKDGRLMACVVIASAWKLSEEFVYEGGSLPGRLELEITSLKGRLGRALILLMEVINKNPAATPVILIADDTATMEHFMPYVPHIRKMDIALYRVKSADEVNKI